MKNVHGFYWLYFNHSPTVEEKSRFVLLGDRRIYNKCQGMRHRIAHLLFEYLIKYSILSYKYSKGSLLEATQIDIVLA